MPSEIEWTDETWNSVRARLRSDPSVIGWHCEHKSPGCLRCYAEARNVSGRCNRGTKLPFKPGHRKDVEIFLDEKTLTRPLHWRKPRRIFVCSMTDLFADFVPDAMIDRIFAVMALCPQHTFQVLTKRADRMRTYLSGHLAPRLWQAMRQGLVPEESKVWPEILSRRHLLPLPNVWLGVSVEDQARADERIPDLLATPAALRFLSCEPLLGPVDLRVVNLDMSDDLRLDAFTGLKWGRLPSRDIWVQAGDFGFDGARGVHRLNWVICGGESGPGARPMHPDWARALRDQCAAAGVPFFFKQWGAFKPDESANCIEASTAYWPDGTIGAGSEAANGGLGTSFWRAGKKAAGRLLDGVEHNGKPEARA